MTRVRVLGIGSPLGDDRVGWLVAERLRQIHAGNETIDIAVLDRPGPAVLDALADCETAILVDAVVSGGIAGTIHRLDLESDLDKLPNLLSSHGFGLADSLRLGAALGRLPARLLIYGIEVHPGAATAAPSSGAVRAAQAVAAEIATLIADTGALTSAAGVSPDVGF